MTGKELKQLAAAIPDEAVVLINGRNIAVVSFGSESPDPCSSSPTVNIEMLSLTPSKKRPFPDVELR